MNAGNFLSEKGVYERDPDFILLRFNREILITYKTGYKTDLKLMKSNLVTNSPTVDAKNIS